MGDGTPSCIAISPYNLYTGDNFGVHEYTQAGASVTQWSLPSGPVSVGAIAVGPDGNVYVGGKIPRTSFTSLMATET